MICQHCGKVLSNEKLAFCNFCGYPLKGENRGFFSKSEETGTSRAEDYAAAQTAPPPAPAPMPQMGMMPNGMPQQPQMNGMPQMGMPGMMPQQQMGMMPNMMPQPQMGMMPNMMPQPQMGMMPNMMPQPQMGMMPNMMPPQPQMGVMPGMMPGAVQPMMNPETDGSMVGYAMPQMYGMPQLAGYDTAGNPLYVQMMPQLIGYDPYGNPMYTMVAVPCQMPMLNPQQPAVIPVPMQPVQPEVYAQPVPQPEAYAQPAPQPEVYAQPAPQPEAYAQPVPQPEAYAQPVPQPQPEAPVQSAPVEEKEPAPADVPVEHVVEVRGEEDIPLSADSLMHEPEEAAPAKPQMPDEQEILDRIFSDAPKGYTMSEGTAPSEHIFSISLGSDEVTSVADEEAQPPKSKKSAKSKEGKAEKPEKAEKAEKKTTSKKKTAAPQKPPVKIISPDEFFDDKPKGRDALGIAELERLSDEQLVAQLNAMNGGAKAHRSIMKSAGMDEIDLSNAVDMSDVTALPH